MTFFLNHILKPLSTAKMQRKKAFRSKAVGATWADLAPDVVSHILRFLPRDDQLALGLTLKSTYALVRPTFREFTSTPRGRGGIYVGGGGREPGASITERLEACLAAGAGGWIATVTIDMGTTLSRTTAVVKLVKQLPGLVHLRLSASTYYHTDNGVAIWDGLGDRWQGLKSVKLCWYNLAAGEVGHSIDAAAFAFSGLESFDITLPQHHLQWTEVDHACISTFAISNSFVTANPRLRSLRMSKHASPRSSSEGSFVQKIFNLELPNNAATWTRLATFSCHLASASDAVIATLPLISFLRSLPGLEEVELSGPHKHFGLPVPTYDGHRLQSYSDSVAVYLNGPTLRVVKGTPQSVRSLLSYADLNLSGELAIDLAVTSTRMRAEREDNPWRGWPKSQRRAWTKPSRPTKVLLTFKEMGERMWGGQLAPLKPGGDIEMVLMVLEDSLCTLVLQGAQLESFGQIRALPRHTPRFFSRLPRLEEIELPSIHPLSSFWSCEIRGVVRLLWCLFSSLPNLQRVGFGDSEVRRPAQVDRKWYWTSKRRGKKLFVSVA